MGKRSSLGLQDYARLTASMIGLDADAADQLLAREGMSREAFEAGRERWRERLEEGNEELNGRYAELFRGALAARAGDGPGMSFDDFVEAAVVEGKGASLAEWGVAQAMSEPLVVLRMLEWRERGARDPRLGALGTLRIALASGGTDRKPRIAQPKVARLVFPRTCPRCGAHKRTEPRTAYVYCDYCAFLFDYDFERQGPASDVPVFDTLVEAVRAELRAQFAAEDWAAYRSTWRWVYETDMELGPAGWSPRIREEGYRKAMLDFSVETCVLRNTSPILRGKADRVESAYLMAFMAPSRDSLFAYFQTLKGELEREVRVYSEHGMWSRHPDELDPATYRYIATVQILGEVLPNADAVARKAIVDAADVRREAVELPPVDTERSTCGSCGGPLIVVKGSKRMVCEGCGVVLDAARRRFPCTQCGAPVLAGTQGAIACAYCGTWFTPPV